MNHTISSELPYWLALSQSPRLGTARIKKLLLHFQTVEMIFKAPAKTLTLYGLDDEQIRAIKHPNPTIIDEALTWTASNTHHILALTDPRYPNLLTEINSAPPLLFIDGDCKLLSQPQIAMVGSRNPTYTGLEIAEAFGYHLAEAGFIVTSGLAFGIDTASHQGALKAGKTIAVLGSGLFDIYPKKNRALAESISEKGCVISEWPLRTKPHPTHFPRRNRIISGLSLGTLVVEAAEKSGSLITARYALEQNRDVFAIPGSIRNTASFGTLSLIQQGAKCVTCVNDILEEFNMHPQLINNPNHACTKRSLDPTSQQVLACIENEMTSIDQICARSKLSAHLVSSALLTLELENWITVRYGTYTRI
ncbi:MAG: DNA-processing protein DprA [Coxiellaceae bacterium]|nr:DNA-processing protein DprA [Coxiellaceae bacterium]